MRAETISDAMNHIDDEIIEDTEAFRQKKKRRKGWIEGAISAACLAVVLGAGLFVADRQQNRIALSENSAHVTARYIEKAPPVASSGDLIYLTEDELFTHWNTAIFKGTVEEIRNIELNFNGEKVYRAVASVTGGSDLPRALRPGDTVSVLLPCPIGGEIWVEDTEIVSAMQVGTTGIFMPVIYTGDSIGSKMAPGWSKRTLPILGLQTASAMPFWKGKRGCSLTGILTPASPRPPRWMKWRILSKIKLKNSVLQKMILLYQ